VRHIESVRRFATSASHCILRRGLLHLGRKRGAARRLAGSLFTDRVGDLDPTTLPNRTADRAISPAVSARNRSFWLRLFDSCRRLRRSLLTIAIIARFSYRQPLAHTIPQCTVQNACDNQIADALSGRDRCLPTPPLSSALRLRASA
jgi:hypothetical protein